MCNKIALFVTFLRQSSFSDAVDSGRPMSLIWGIISLAISLVVLDLESGGSTHGQRSSQQASGQTPKPLESFGFYSVGYRCVHMEGCSHSFVSDSIAQLHTRDGSQTSNFK